SRVMAQIAAQPSNEIARLRREELLLDKGYIGGTWSEADGGGTFPVVDPATGQELARVPRMGADETRRAIDAARDAYPSWRGTLAKERARILRRWADLLLEHRDELALLLTSEQGKPLGESRTAHEDDA